MLIDADGCPLQVEIEGPASAPVLMLSNSLGTTLHMWDAQIEPFTRRFRVLRYDRRGHGGSGVTPAPYSMERLARDALAILDRLGIASVNWCGLSMGGMEGMWLAANARERIARLVLSNTSAYYADKRLWDERIAAIRAKGVAAFTDRILGLWFNPQFRARNRQEVARLTRMLAATPLEGYVGCCMAIRDMDHRELLARIAAPTLVIAGRYDQATPPEAGSLIQSRVPGASFSLLDAAHIANVEQPTLYADTVLRFLDR